MGDTLGASSLTCLEPGLGRLNSSRLESWDLSASLSNCGLSTWSSQHGGLGVAGLFYHGSGSQMRMSEESKAFVIQPWRSHSITSTSFCSLESSPYG